MYLLMTLYLCSMYINEYRKLYPMASDIAVDRQIEHDFPRWFAENVSTNTSIF